MSQERRNEGSVLDHRHADDQDLQVHGIVRGGRTDERAPARRGLQQRRPSTRAPGGRTRDQLYEEAKALDIPGRSAMDKRQLEQAIDRRRGRR